MKPETWSKEYNCYECSFCEQPQGSLMVGTLRLCKEHEKMVSDKNIIIKSVENK